MILLQDPFRAEKPHILSLRKGYVFVWYGGFAMYQSQRTWMVSPLPLLALPFEFDLLLRNEHSFTAKSGAEPYLPCLIVL